MKVLITGSTGQTASYLCDYLKENHPEVEMHCTRRWRSREEHIGSFKNDVIWHNCDMRDQFNAQYLVKKIMPDKIFIYSANSFVRDSWFSPYSYLEENTYHLLNVMNSILIINNVDINKKNDVTLQYNPKIFVALSSEEYGHVKHGTVITEEHPLLPVSPYGVSKVTADLLAFQYYMSYGMNVLRIRTFNHESARRGDIFVTGNFVKQVVQMELGIREKVLHVGNTASVRDWLSAKDVIKAAWIATEKCIPGEAYNVCSGKAHTIDEFIERCRELSTIDFRIEVDENRIRPSDVTWLLGSNEKFVKVTGWKPEYDFMQDTVPEMFSYWRNRLKG